MRVASKAMHVSPNLGVLYSAIGPRFILDGRESPVLWSLSTQSGRLVSQDSGEINLKTQPRDWETS